MTTPVTVSVIPQEEPETSSTVYVDDGQPGTLAGLFALVSAQAVEAPELQVSEPIGLQQAKDHLRVFIPDDDAYIMSLIAAARQAAEGRLNRTIVQRRRVARFSGWGASMALLKPPVISVDSIGYYDETGSEVNLDPSRFYMAPVNDDELPYVELRAGESYPVLDRRRQPVVVYYTAGYAPGEVPADIVQWMLLVIGTMYNNRESVVNGVASTALGDDFAKWLLQPHVVYE